MLLALGRQGEKGKKECQKQMEGLDEYRSYLEFFLLLLNSLNHGTKGKAISVTLGRIGLGLPQGRWELLCSCKTFLKQVMLVSRCLLLLRSRSSASLLFWCKELALLKVSGIPLPQESPQTDLPRWLLWDSVDFLKLICCSASVGVFKEKKLMEKICPFSALVLLEWEGPISGAWSIWTPCSWRACWKQCLTLLCLWRPQPCMPALRSEGSCAEEMFPDQNDSLAEAGLRPYDFESSSSCLVSNSQAVPGAVRAGRPLLINYHTNISSQQ